MLHTIDSEGGEIQAPPTRVLYIEDDLGLARLLKKHLERQRYSVELACDPEQGLLLVGREHYAVVLIDYDLPVLNGMELIRRLAQLGEAPPVIMLTAHGNEKVAVEAMKLGASDYLVKDLEMGYLEILPMIIEQVLQRERLIREQQEILNEARESEERYRKLVELSPDGIAVHSEGRFRFVNPAAARILGASCYQELVGRPMLEFVHPDYHLLVSQRLALLEENGVELPWLEQVFLRLDRCPVDVEVIELPIIFNGSAAFQTVFRNITERKVSERRLERMANYDALTGLPNRTLFFDRLNQLIAQASRERLRFALLFLDLDHFKQANDRLGHRCGDLLLKEVALRLASCVRDADTVARIGGDEFVVILPRAPSRADIAAMARRISEAIARPYAVQGREWILGASIGISLFPQDGQTREQQLISADTAMYRCKKLGRNNYQFYSPESDDGRAL